MAAPAFAVVRRLRQDTPPQLRAELAPVPAVEQEAPRRVRRLLPVLLVVLLAFGLDAAWRWAVGSEIFALQRVTLDGELHRVSPQELQAAVAPQIDGGMLRLDVAAVRAAIEELPWVAAATVRRQWPGTLELALREQVALAWWNDSAVFNEQGAVFHPPPESVTEQLPRLRGPQGSEQEVLARYRALQPLLAPVGLRIIELTLDERRSWGAVLDGDITMRLGRGGFEAELRRFIAVYPQLAVDAGGSLNSVDLRYPNGFALGWDAGGTDGRGNSRE